MTVIIIILSYMFIQTSSFLLIFINYSNMKEAGQQTYHIYTKCDEYNNPTPIVRENVDLLAALKQV